MTAPATRYAADGSEPSASAAWALAHARLAAEDRARSEWLDAMLRRDPEPRTPPVPTGQCGCGCGTVIETRDPWGRTRRYANGHSGAARRKGRTCTIPGCTARHDSHGLCAKHRAAARKAGTLPYYKPAPTNSGSVAGE